ncbi:MAG: PTS sugar transporter subunit IIC [Myxococcaceae bacterium]|nr:PTS sugar transporter subunit IIC [Myxococcaceae bacterium]
MVGWLQVAVAGLFGGLLAVERRAFLQAMASRPLVAGTGMGLLLGDVTTGLFVGLLLELFHLGGAALGAALPEHDTFAATATSAAAVALVKGAEGVPPPALWSLAVVLFAWTGRVGRRVDRLLERYSGRLAGRAQVSARAGELRRAMRQNLWGMWPHFVLFGLGTSACLLAGALLSPWAARLPERVVQGLVWAYPAMASVSAASAARGSRARHAGLFAGGAAALVTFMLVAWWLLGRRA